MSDRLTYQGVPNQSTPVLDNDGTMTLPWYRFFTNLAKITGLSTPGVPVTFDETGTKNENSTVITARYQYGGGAGIYLRVLRQTDGTLLGYIGPLVI